MRQIESPTKLLTWVFGIIAVLGIVAGIAGFAMGTDTSIAIGITGLIFGLVCGGVAPFLVLQGKKQVREIQALMAGENLLAHWSFDADEWERYTRNEYQRGMGQAKKTTLWTFIITIVVMLAISWFADAISSAVVLLVDLAVAAGLAALFGGVLYLGTQSNHAANRKGVGEVYIGGTGIYFGTRYYSWKGAFAKLQKVALETGDPSVVQFNYQVGSGENAQHNEVRIPVPRGREEEAQALVNSFYGAD